MIHFVNGLATATLLNLYWGDTFYLSFLFAVPPSGPDSGTATIASGPDWTITYNYGTGVVTATRGTSVLVGAVSIDHCIHMVVWDHNNGSDTASLYLDDPATPVSVDTSAGFAVLRGGAFSVGASGQHSMLIGNVRLAQATYDTTDGATWAGLVGCCFEQCTTTIPVDGGSAGPVTVTYPWTADGVSSTFNWPDRALAGTMQVSVKGGDGGRWSDPVAVFGGAGGSVSGTLNDSFGSTFTIHPGEGGHNTISGGFGGGSGGSDGRGGDAGGGSAFGGHGYVAGAGAAGGGAGTELLLDGVEIVVAGGGGGGGSKTILTPYEDAGAGGSGVSDGGHGDGNPASSFYGEGGRGGTLTGPGGMALGPSFSTTVGTGAAAVGRVGADAGNGKAGGGGYFGGGGGGTSRGGGGGSSWGDTGAFSGAIGSTAFGTFPTRTNIGTDGGVAFRYSTPAAYLTGWPGAAATYPQQYVPTPGLPGTIVGIDEFELELTGSWMTTAQSARVAVVDTALSGNVGGDWFTHLATSTITVGPITYRRLANWTGTIRIRFEFATPIPIDQFMVVIDQPLSGLVTVNEWAMSWTCALDTNKVSVGMLLAN